MNKLIHIGRTRVTARGAQPDFEKELQNTIRKLVSIFIGDDDFFMSLKSFFVLWLVFLIPGAKGAISDNSCHLCATHKRDR